MKNAPRLFCSKGSLSIPEIPIMLKAEAACADCGGCEKGCNDHPNIPDAIDQRIVKDSTLTGTVQEHIKHVVFTTTARASKWSRDIEDDRNSYAAVLGAALKKNEGPLKGEKGILRHCVLLRLFRQVFVNFALKLTTLCRCVPCFYILV